MTASPAPEGGDVVARIGAALDRLEATAKAATPGPWEAYNNPGYPGALTADDRVLFTAEDGFGIHADAAHIALNDPAAVLRIVAGLRAILALNDEALAREVRARDQSALGAALMHADVVRLIVAMFPADPTEATP